MQNVFLDIYAQGHWGQGSGPGSAPEYCAPLVEFLTRYFSENKIRSVVDLGCGDLQWAPELVRAAGVTYTGIDCVESLIEQHRRTYSAPTFSFQCADISTLDPADVPVADVYLLKDVLQHWPDEHITAYLRAFFLARPEAHVLVANCCGQQTDNRTVDGVARFAPLDGERWPLRAFKPQELFNWRSKKLYRLHQMNEQFVAYQQRARDFLAQVSDYPAARYSGRGIVICAGGTKYFTNAWITVNILRMHGCNLPIEFWHLKDEMDDEMRELVKPLGVTCVDATKVREQHPVRTLNGWELKPYAIIHSAFEEVMLLDAENCPVRNPEYLFETEQYDHTGAIFWPDYGRLGPDRLIWQAMDVPYRDEPEFESGQIVVHKRKCWRALQLTMHLNEHSDFYYQHIHGDKETFHLAWRRLDQPYSMPPFGIHSLAGTMCQHDFEGNRIFQHRNMRKWSLDGISEPVGDFRYEAECRRYLEELRQKWSLAPKRKDDPAFQSLVQQIEAQRFYGYTRVGYDSRIIELRPDGSIDASPGAVEQQWRVIGTAQAPRLGMFQNGMLLADLTPLTDGRFEGRWVIYEQMPIVLAPQLPVFDQQVSPQYCAAHDLSPTPERRTLHLGCGNRPIKDAVNHDLYKHGEHVDVAHDLESLPWPWADESFDRIVAIDVFEHLSLEVQQWLDECWRLLTPGGLLELRVPYYGHENAFTDPTHKRFFAPKTFDYWDKSKAMHIDFGCYYFARSNKWWRVQLVAQDGNMLFHLFKDA